MGVCAIADCREGSTTPSFLPLGDDCMGEDGLDAELEGDGVEGGEGRPGVEASEFRERALPLLYTPGGTEMVRKRGSWSTVGMLGRSA